MEPVLYMSQSVFCAVMYIVMTGLGGTAALPFYIRPLAKIRCSGKIGA